MGDRGQWVEAHIWRTEDGDTKAGRDMMKMKIGDGDAKVARCARSRAIDTKIRRYEDAEIRRCGDKMIINDLCDEI